MVTECVVLAKMVGSLDEPFPFKPETTEYEVLRVLVTHREEELTPPEIAAETGLSTARTAETLGQLSKAEIVNQENGDYYIDSRQAARMKQRLESVDAVVQLFESAPDDAYARAGWEEQVPSLSREEEPERVNSQSETAEEAAETLIEELEEELASG